jgi:hypothetical protein
VREREAIESIRRAVVITVAPARLRRFTIASPMPLVPPVTRTRLPVNSFASNGMSDDVVIATLRTHYVCSCWGALISSLVMNDDKDNIQLSAVEDHDEILMPVRSHRGGAFFSYFDIRRWDVGRWLLVRQFHRLRHLVDL